MIRSLKEAKKGCVSFLGKKLCGLHLLHFLVRKVQWLLLSELMLKKLRLLVTEVVVTLAFYVFAVAWIFYDFSGNIRKFKIMLKDIFCHKKPGSPVKVNGITDGVPRNLGERKALMFTRPRRNYQSLCRILKYRKFRVDHIVIVNYM